MTTRKAFKSTMLALCGAFIIGISSGTAQAGVAEENLIAQPQIETADTSNLLSETNPQMQQMRRDYGPPPPPPRHRYGPPPRHHHGPPPPPPRRGHHWPPPPPPPPRW